MIKTEHQKIDMILDFVILVLVFAIALGENFTLLRLEAARLTVCDCAVSLPVFVSRD